MLSLATRSLELKKEIRNYKPDLKRKERGLNYVSLYEGLIVSYEHSLRLVPNDFMRNVFLNEYAYNDSRVEGINIDIKTAAEIVTDIRLSTHGGKYCTKEDEPFLSIAGHTAMYSYIFELPVPEECSVFETIKLHRKLFSYFPCPEFGGQFRESNNLVLGAKFETVDYKNIFREMIRIDKKVKLLYKNRTKYSISSYIKTVVQLHHELTVIHPFGDGNGRTLRAFLNVLMVRNKLTPVYIKVEDKNDDRAGIEPVYLAGDWRHRLFQNNFFDVGQGKVEPIHSPDF